MIYEIFAVMMIYPDEDGYPMAVRSVAYHRDRQEALAWLTDELGRAQPMDALDMRPRVRTGLAGWIQPLLVEEDQLQELLEL